MAASSVGGGLAPQLRCDLGFRDGRYPPPPPRSCLRPPRRVSRLICGGGARPGAAASRNQQRQLGELEAEAEAGLEHQRSSPREVREEMARCFDLVRRLGRGAVYLRSSRVPPTHPHYLHSTELAREIARLLDCTTWTGAGSGLMDDAIQGALELDKPVGGFKISKEAGEWTSSNFHPYLPPETYLTCSPQRLQCGAALPTEPLWLSYREGSGHWTSCLRSWH